MTRSISHSEVETLLDCGLRWDLSYGGTLLGGLTIASPTKNVYLRRGTAWGNAVAKWHITGDVMIAGVEIIRALDADAEAMRQAGIFDPDERDQLEELLLACLADYAQTAGRIENYGRPEHELDVEIPGAPGFRLVCRLDAVAGAPRGDWIIEHKFRSSLSTLDDIERQRQHRWYAWAWRQETGREVLGVVVDERLAEVPSPVRLNKPGKDGVAHPSRVQSCSADDYAAACREVGDEPDPEILDRLAAKRYHRREPIVYTPRELDEAEAQLVSAARLISLHETGELYPIRNAKPAHCRGCFARDLCLTPTDVELAHALYETRPPKRFRDTEDK